MSTFDPAIEVHTLDEREMCSMLTTLVSRFWSRAHIRGVFVANSFDPWTRYARLVLREEYSTVCVPMPCDTSLFLALADAPSERAAFELLWAADGVVSEMF